MPRRREPFDPYHPKKHETTKSARRNYLKRQALNLGPSPSQLRRIEAAQAASQRAKEIRERDKKREKVKKARLEKERKEREARQKLVDQGKLKPEDLLPKVAASQPRLTTFFGGLKARFGAGGKKPAEAVEEDLTESEDRGLDTSTDDLSDIEDEDTDSCLDGSDSETEEEEDAPEHLAEEEERVFTFGAKPKRSLSQGSRLPEIEQSPSKTSPSAAKDLQHPVTDLEILESYISQMTQSQESSKSETLREEGLMGLPKSISQDSGLVPVSRCSSPDSVQEQVDAQLSSETQYELGSALEIFEDLDANGMPRNSRSQPSKKRKVDEVEDEPLEVRNKRQIFAQMSPSKVNVRAQEKPDPVCSQIPAADLLAGLCTQDLAFSFGEDHDPSDKENSVPEVTKKSQSSGKEIQKDGSSQESALGSFEAALQELAKASQAHRAKDADTDSLDFLDLESDFGQDDFPVDEDAWLQEAIKHNLPPTPTKVKPAEPPPTTGKGKRKSDSCDSLFDLDDADLLEIAEACDKAELPKKKRRRLPWSDASQKAEPVQAGPSGGNGGEDGSWDALQTLASTFPADF